MAQDWFFDVAIDDFMFVPDPPGAVTSGPIVMMSLTARNSLSIWSFAIVFGLSSRGQWANEGTSWDSLVVASSTVDPNSLKLLGGPGDREPDGPSSIEHRNCFGFRNRRD